jgi:O-antigen ligase
MATEDWLFNDKVRHLFNLLLSGLIFLIFWTLSRVIFRSPQPVWAAGWALVIFLITLKNSLWAFYLLPWASLLSPQVNFPNLYEIIFLAFTGVWFLDLIIKRDSPLVKTPLDKPLILLVLLILVSLFIAKDFFMSRQAMYTKEYLYLIILYFITVNLLGTPQKIENYLWNLLAGATVVSLYGIFQFTTGSNLIPYFQESNYQVVRRIQSFMENPNYLGQYLILFLPLSFFLAVKLKKIFPILSTVLIAMALLFTFSFSAFFGLAGGCFLFLIVFYKALFKAKENFYFFKKSYFKVLLVFILLAGIFFSLAMNNLWLTKIHHFSARYTQIWPLAIKTIVKKPFWGTGLGQYTLFFNRGVLLKVRREALAHLHNAYLQMAVDLGLIGLSLTLWVFIGGLFLLGKSYFTDNKKNVQPVPVLNYIKLGLFCGLTSLAVALLGDNTFNFFWFWLFLGILAASLRAGFPAEIFKNEPETKFAKVEQVAFVVFFVVIAGYFLKNFMTVLPDNFESRFESFCTITNLNKEGWYEPLIRDKKDPVPDACWMAEAALITIENKSPRPAEVTVAGQVLGFLFPRTLKVSLNGWPIWQKKIEGTTRNGRYQKISFNPSLKPGKNIIVFYCPEGVDSPYFMAIEKDYRWFSFNFKKNLSVKFSETKEVTYPLEVVFLNVPKES